MKSSVPPKVLTRFWEGSHLITSKIKHNTDIVNNLGWLMLVNLSVLSSPIFLMASISNSSNLFLLSPIDCISCYNLNASSSPLISTLKLIKRTYIQDFPG